MPSVDQPSPEKSKSTPPPAELEPGGTPAAGATGSYYPARGQTWDGRFEIIEPLGKEAGGMAYKARDTGAGGQVVALWVLPPEVRAAVALDELRQDIAQVQPLEHKNIVRVFGWGEAQGGLYVWMEHVGGQRLSDLMAKKRRVAASSAAFSLKGSYNLVAHLLQALAAAHPRVVHGALSPEAVLIDGRGRVRLRGLGVLRHLPPSPGNAAYRAPEAVPVPATDLYAAALIFAELATGKQGTLAVAALTPPLLREAIGLATDPDPSARPADVEGFRAILQEALQQAKAEEELYRQQTEMEITVPSGAGIDTPLPASPQPAREACSSRPAIPAAAASPSPGSPPPRALPAAGPSRPPEALPPGPLTPPPPGGKGDGVTITKRSRSSMLLHRALERLKAPGKQEAIWLAHRDGLDYGPFTVDELTDRVRKQEFDQTTVIQDLTSGQRKPLLEFPEFQGPLARLLREREAKQREAEAVRQGQIRSAKKVGKRLMLLIFLGGAGFVGFTSWIILHSPTPKQLLFSDAMASLGRPITLPAIEPAEAIAERIRAEEEAKAAAQARARALARLNYVPGSDRELGDDQEFERVVQRIDMSAAAPAAGTALTDTEVDRVVRARWGRFSSCVAKELKRNPNLDHATITFWVRGDGTTGGTKIVSNGTQRMFDCLKSEIASLRFRAHGGLPRKVTYPLQVDR